MHFYPDQKSNNNNNVNKIRSLLENYNFLNALFLGVELDSLLHDVLMHDTCDLTFEDVVISALLTHGMCSLRNFVRKWLGCKNVANKACVDHRFFF